MNKDLYCQHTTNPIQIKKVCKGCQKDLVRKLILDIMESGLEAGYDGSVRGMVTTADKIVALTIKLSKAEKK